MSIAQSERLKTELTDQYVVVQEGVPELRRFVGLTGQIKTVNMNCRALVQFDGPVDISWYDIDPAYLKIVAAPPPKAAGHAAKPAAVAESKAAAPKAPAGKSPVDLAREQGVGGKAISPLELARQQGAAKAAAPVVEAAVAAEPAPAVVETPAPAVAAPSAGRGGLVKPGTTAEIIALARQQGAAKRD